MKNITKTYTVEDLTVKWEPHKCIHSAICFHGLPMVFDPRKRPWINITRKIHLAIGYLGVKCYITVS